MNNLQYKNSKIINNNQICYLNTKPTHNIMVSQSVIDIGNSIRTELTNIKIDFFKFNIFLSFNCKILNNDLTDKYDVYVGLHICDRLDYLEPFKEIPYRSGFFTQNDLYKAYKNRKIVFGQNNKNSYPHIVLYYPDYHQVEHELTIIIDLYLKPKTADVYYNIRNIHYYYRITILDDNTVKILNGLNEKQTYINQDLIEKKNN